LGINYQLHGFDDWSVPPVRRLLITVFSLDQLLKGSAWASHAILV
jgi:hypothetical protein